MAVTALDKLIERANSGDTEGTKALLNIASESLEKEEQVLKGTLSWVLPLVTKLYLLEIAATNPVYLALPSALVQLEQDTVYQASRHYGRLLYRLDEYTLTDDLEAVRSPHRYSRNDLYQFINQTIRIEDTPLHVALPLPYRVGVVVGWLSALSISQVDDAQAGLVILAALVAPLLVPQHAGPGVTLKPSRLLSRPSTRRRSARPASK